MKTSYGYDTYRGRTKLQTALTVLIVILLLVLLLAVAAFFFLQRYMVYTDDGQAHLELPFLQRETPAPSVPTQDQPLVIVTAEPVETSTPEPTAPPVPKVPAIAPVSLFRAAVTEGSAQRLVTAAGGNAALLNMKANDGSLGYVSADPKAISLGTSAAEPELNGQILTITGSELYTIARVSCFKDNLAPKVDNSLAIKTASGYNWRDGEERRWLDLSLPTVRQYVTGICVELADMGFDEIVLDNSGWPTTGRLDHIRGGDDPSADRLTAPVEAFYQEVREALKDKGVLVSVSVSAAELNGNGALSGQSAALLGQYADRVYVLGAGAVGACDEVLSAAGLTGDAVIYVDPEVSDLSTTGKLVAAK